MALPSPFSNVLSRLPYSRHAWVITLLFVLLVGIPMHLGWIPAYALTAQGFITVLVATLGDRRSGLISGMIAATLVLSASMANLSPIADLATPVYLAIDVIWALTLSYYLGWLRESLQEAVSSLESHGESLLVHNESLAGDADQHLRELERIKDRLVTSQEGLRTVTKRWVDAQENDRRRLARELHDDIGQSLTALRINLESNKDKFADNPEGLRIIVSSYRLVDEIISSVREISLNLRPSLLDDLGLAAALREFVFKQSGKANVKCDFSVDGTDHFINPAHSIAIYRIAQETVSHILQRGVASRVHVSMSIASTSLLLSITSNESHPREFENSGELHSLQERVTLVGGTLQINNPDADHTIIEVSVPLQETSGETNAA